MKTHLNFLKMFSYANLTSSSLYCKLKGETVGLFNGTMIVSEDYGRSLSDPASFFVTPDESIYNYQTFAGKYQ